MTLAQQPAVELRPNFLAAPIETVAPAKPALVPNATLLAREDVTESMAAFTFAVDSSLERYRPGQYVSLGVFDGSGWVQRPYSVVSVDGASDRVELFIRQVPGGALSPRLWSLPVGARVRVGPPKGLFVLDEDDQRPRLFIGTGTGLAPLLSMLDEMVSRADDIPSALVHGVSYRDELAYGYRIAAWMATGLPLLYRPCVSRPSDGRNEGWRGLTGRAEVAVARALEQMPPLAGGVAYLCGNPSMIEACSLVLRQAGMAEA
ncbi:MAG TPA: FAD-binding oxidoreductase, partial [Candidatus Limnocylindria bacterium]|nr:FAD-binding oxidoreductase [Candidatus Limnocylindria bacterium]